MNVKRLKVLSLSTLIAGVLFVSSGCGCNAGKVKVTFVSEGNNDIVRYVKKGKSLYDLPKTPEVKAKYCVWDREDFKNLNEDITVTAICYSTVTELYTNIPEEINVDVSTPEAELSYILKDMELEATFESGETKKLYDGEYIVESNNYDKDKGGTYTVSIKYNNAKKDIKINVNKINNYVTVSLNGGIGYYNEGLPSLIANTNVAGSVSFDEGQTLYEGIKAYSWTFTPADTNKYSIVKGKIDVELQKAKSIIANKSSLTVDFGTSKQEIIELIKDGLVVSGRFGNTYKEIEPEYYTIDSSDFVADKSGVFTFKVIYDSKVYTDPGISVEVKKCEDYSLSVNNISSFIMKKGSKLNDVLSFIEKSGVEGTLEFVEGQELNVGEYEYEYVFTPSNAHYAPKEGTIKIKVYKAFSISDFDMDSSFEYGLSVNEIKEQMLNSIEGTLIYNDSLTLPIEKDKITITIDSGYSNLTAGIYDYIVSYNDEIDIAGTFTLEKRVLKNNLDFTISCKNVDPDNKDIMPLCALLKSQTTEFDYDVGLFNIVPLYDEDGDIIFEDKGNGIYIYSAEIVPDESISGNYATVKVQIMAFEPIKVS